MHIYAFGSICRGDIDRMSDIDLLAIVEGFDDHLDPARFSIYGYPKMMQLWQSGNPFAWHLHVEAKLLYASDDRDFLGDLEEPNPYLAVASDCVTFKNLFEDAAAALEADSPSPTFELSTLFLAIRNFATCFALGRLGLPEFSRQSALRIGEHSLMIDRPIFSVLERCRILSTRGWGMLPDRHEVEDVRKALPTIRAWMQNRTEEI